MKRLIPKVDLDNKDWEGQTSLHRAAVFGHNKVIQVLCKHNPAADTEAEDEDKETPLHYAAEEGKISTCKLLVESYSGGTQVVLRLYLSI